MAKREIAKVLQRCRLSAGLTQRQAAERLGRPQSTIAAWETGKTQPDTNTLFSLCCLYGVNVDEAFCFTDPATPPALGRPMSGAEIDLIKKYRALDERGRAAVDCILSQQHDALFGQKGDSPLPDQP